MLKLLSYNIRFGGTGREAQIAEVISGIAPDAVILQEATDPQAVEKIAAACGMGHWASREGYSLGYLSREKPDHHEWHRLEEMRRPFLELRFGSLTVFGVHLSAIHGNWTERRRTRELRAMLRSTEPHRGSFHLFTGDFNTLAPGELLDTRKLPRRLRILAWALGGRLRFRTIQMMLDAGYRDGYRSLHTDDGLTFPTWDPHVRLDHVFLPADHIEKLAECEVVTGHAAAATASDHFPLLSVIDVGRR
jgi:endonuclease/exonuclease/phosphatase family metal-dependent hydrolase